VLLVAFILDKILAGRDTSCLVLFVGSRIEN
jgi:hypothetical protein